MRTLTIRKAYKTSCELKERSQNAKSAISQSAKYEVFDALGKLSDVIEGLHNQQSDEVAKNLSAIKLVCDIRQRIQAANNVPLAYAANQSINDLIAKQASLKMMLAFYPEENEIPLTSEVDLGLQARRHKTILEDATNMYRNSTNANLVVNGTSQSIKDQLTDERLALRVELESVTGQLAYANITETVEITDEEAEILRSFRIPV